MIARETPARRVVDKPRLDAETDYQLFKAPRRRPALRAKPRPIHKIKNLHARADMDAILHRECARCERNGHEFSLVLIAAADSGATRHLHRLAALLCRRARATDEIGWFDARHLGAVLPDTSGEGAMYFIRQFIDAANQKTLSPICKTMTYHGQPHSRNELLSVEQIVRALDEAGQDVELSEGARTPPAPSDAEQLPLLLQNSSEVTALLVRPIPLWKRGLDIALGGTALVMSLVPMAVIALVIKFSDSGPIFFKQKRAGLGGKPFTIYKFRTMVVGAESQKSALQQHNEQDGPAFKIKHDPRITRVGRFLRETSLDEVPQLWNVVKGDMSLVGPRPLPIDESDRCATWHRRRLDVTPGLTCTWQIKGRSTVSFVEWIRMDRSYVRARSLLHDIKLMLLTIPSMIMRRGR
jgi:lipopolysaccharide/colanic/teichoic acid biosynthesis glycosyltransferase